MTYLAFDNILEQAHAAISAAEAHGIAAGMLCVDIQTTAETWLTEVFVDEVFLSDVERAQLESLFEQTHELLENGGFDFDLLLPEEDTPMSVRIEALRNWCQGFLLGIGFTRSEDVWPGECGELLKDIVEFTCVDGDVEGEDDEAALTEISEYIRVCVQLIREELFEGGKPKTLH